MLRRCLVRHFLALNSFETPNPNSFTFRIPEGAFESFTPEGMTCEAQHRGLSDIHPFAHNLFEQYAKEVTSVFIAPRYVTITKFAQIAWDEKLERSISSFIGHYLVFSTEPVAPRSEYQLIEDDTKILPQDSEVLQCIKELIKTEIRPMVQRDGGDVKLLNFNEKTGIVSIAMLGACRTCPSSQNTLKGGIERMLRHFLPEVNEVVEVKGHEFHTDYELKFKNEADLYKENARVDAERLKKQSKPSARGIMAYDALSEPDGDA